jgi:integrase
MCERFIEQLVPKKRPNTQTEYRAAIDKIILPAWRNRKVDEITFTDVEALHRKISKGGTRGTRPAPYRANRVLSVLSKMFRLAKRWGWITALPTEGIERNQESKRERYLRPDELDALLQALAEHPRTGRKEDQQRRQTAADIVRLLLLTGARRGEVCSMRWCDVDLSTGTWTKPAASTKQKRIHRAPLSAPAQLLLSGIRTRRKNAADDDAVFPGRGTDAPQATLKKSWSSIRSRATVILYAADPKSPIGALVRQLRKSLKREPSLAEVAAAAAAVKVTIPAGLQDLRMHDLRHSYASFLVNEGMSLPTIGALLGHTQAQTTHRYAHLFDDPLRKATERVGAIITGARDGAVIKLRQARR